MPSQKIQVLFALRDAAHFPPLEEAFPPQNTETTLGSSRNIEDLLDRLQMETPGLLVLELHNNATPLEKVRAEHPDLPIVVLLEKPTVQLSFAASRLGAEDVLTWPLDEVQVAERMQTVLEKIARQRTTSPPTSPFSMPAKAAPIAPAAAPTRAVMKEVTKEDAKEEKSKPLPTLIGSNPRIVEIRDLVSKVAETDATVLIRGESGVGKEIVARMVFESSRRVHKPFVKVNCAAIPNDLLESELFGYDAGAFTGATRQKPGKFELADTGTLFLDEIGEMHPLLQAKLLHVLQDGQFARLGAKHDISVNVRVLCATNKLLEQRVAEGLFREDLYYRINVVTVHIPPLRERRDEIPLLTRHFLEKYAAEYRRPLRFFSQEVERQMLAYRWPGNIRELENLCKRFVIVGGETQILRELSQRLPGKQEPANTVPPPEDSQPEQEPAKADTRPTTSKDRTQSELTTGPSLLEIGRRAAWQAERQAIQQMLLETHWNRREAASRLRVSYKALLNKIKQLETEDKINSGIEET